MTRPPLDIERIASQLTLEEKIALLAGSDLWRTVPFPEKGLPYAKLTDGPNGARGGGAFHASVPAALFPAPTALGATWDASLAYRMGKGIAQDSRSKQAHVSLAPTINIQRDPRGGRSFEAYSEDPILSGDLAAAWVNGCQSEGILATPKHFVANECETKRRTVSSEVDEASLRELYLRPFQRMMRTLKLNNQEAPGCIMTAYNKLNGEYCSQNERLLQNVLREEWGFEGLVMSDWFGLYSTPEGIKAGLDLEMPGPTIHRRVESVKQALSAGRITEADIEARVQKVLKLIEKVDQKLLAHSPPLDFPKSVADEREVSLENEEIRQSIRTIASEGMVLLRNENNLLPLEPSTKDGPKKIAFIGTPAVEAIQSGGGSANLTPQYKTPPLSSFKQALKDLGEKAANVEVVYAAGCQLRTEPLAPTLEHVGAEKVTLKWFNDVDTAEKGNPCLVTTQDEPSFSHFSGLPKGVGNPSSVKVHFSITPKTSGEHTFSVQAYGRCTLKVGSKSWSYESESNALDYLVAMGINRKLEQVHLQAGEKVDVEFDYRPFDSDGTLSRTRFVSFKLGFDEYCDEDKMMQEAAEVAKDADVAIVFTATGQEYETEGFDRPHMKLPRRQDDLVEAILKVQPKKTIVVNLTGSAVEMPWVDNIPALVQAWFPGQECGRAIAEVLLGQGRAGGPTGRMPSTWPKKIEDHASYGNFPIDTEDDPKQPVVHYKERKLVGHKWYEEKDIEPQFWLGEGLSYTTWKRTLVSSEGSITSNGGRVTVKVLVENTGKRSGKDVVQIYMKPDQASKDKPKRSLAAFATVLLNPGESQTVTLQFDQEAVSYWEHGENGHWKVEKGIYEMVLATSANPKDEIASQKVEVSEEWTWRGLGYTGGNAQPAKL
ncbi:hypothetical protein VKS41_001111 [Umbelopsis sp. WA50703]